MTTNRHTAEYRRSARQPGYKRMSRDEYLTRALEMCPRGEDAPGAKLTDADVRKIRENREGHSLKQLAKIYGVSYNYLCKVYHREAWGHVR